MTQTWRGPLDGADIIALAELIAQGWHVEVSARGGAQDSSRSVSVQLTPPAPAGPEQGGST
jgi:hypothetical protein